jgi:hypothetical protein
MLLVLRLHKYFKTSVFSSARNLSRSLISEKIYLPFYHAFKLHAYNVRLAIGRLPY